MWIATVSPVYDGDARVAGCFKNGWYTYQNTTTILGNGTLVQRWSYIVGDSGLNRTTVIDLSEGLLLHAVAS